MAMTERAGAAVERAAERHHRLWGAPELVSRAPGRVNLIGDHTDHNDGFVLPMAIPLDTAIAVSRNPRGVDSEVVSEGFGRAVLGPRQTRIDPSDWAAHIRGVSRLLAEQGVRPEPWRASIATDVPIGAGLSSSAALEVAACQVLLRLSGVEWSAAEIARLASRPHESGMSRGADDWRRLRRLRGGARADRWSREILRRCRAAIPRCRRYGRHRLGVRACQWRIRPGMIRYPASSSGGEVRFGLTGWALARSKPRRTSNESSNGRSVIGGYPQVRLVTPIM